MSREWMKPDEDMLRLTAPNGMELSTTPHLRRASSSLFDCLSLLPFLLLLALFVCHTVTHSLHSRLPPRGSRLRREKWTASIAAQQQQGQLLLLSSNAGSPFFLARTAASQCIHRLYLHCTYIQFRCVLSFRTLSQRCVSSWLQGAEGLANVAACMLQLHRSLKVDKQQGTFQNGGPWEATLGQCTQGKCTYYP